MASTQSTFDKMAAVCQKVFGERLIDINPNLYNPELGYATIKHRILDLDLRELNILGYHMTNIEAGATLQIHIAPNFKPRKSD